MFEDSVELRQIVSSFPTGSDIVLVEGGADQERVGPLPEVGDEQQVLFELLYEDVGHPDAGVDLRKSVRSGKDGNEGVVAHHQ